VTASTATQAAYIVAALLFILSLAGLSKHESAKSGLVFGIGGMVIALVATIGYAIAGPSTWPSGLTAGGIVLLFLAMAIGAALGIVKARRVEMTGMPELIAMLHS